jgi:SPP1 family predicted phage head-tail adaptor
MSAGYYTREYAHWRETQTPDGAGGFVTEWAQIGTIEGRASPRTQSEEAIGARLQGKVTWVFATTPDVDLQLEDEIRFDGRALRVLSYAPTSSGRRVQAECEEMQP